MNQNLCISVVILTKNSNRTIKACLDALLKSTPLPAEVIIVDGGSIDGTLETVRRTLDGKIPYKILHDRGRGLGYARDIGWRNSICEYIAMVDSDVMIPQTFFKKALKIMERDPKVGSLGAKLKPICKEPGWLARFQEKNLAIHLHWDDPVYPKEAIATHTACTMFRRGALEDVGGFDHAFRLAKEDSDISFKLKKAGYKISYLNLYALHLETAKRFWSINFRYGRSYVHIAKKYPRDAPLWTIKNTVMAIALFIIPLQTPLLLNYMRKYSKLRDLTRAEKALLPFIELLRQATRIRGMIYELCIS